jgi:hypothetical protein
MKMNTKKISILFIILLVLPLILAHSGRTDSRGGHRDNQNKSGLGSYHYHCGGHPPHLHDGGVCPYDNNSYSNSSNAVSGQPSTKKSVKPKAKPTPAPTIEPTPEPIIIDPDRVIISVIDSQDYILVKKKDDRTEIWMEKGSELTLKASVLPKNATNQEAVWKPSNRNIRISSAGVVCAEKIGSTILTLKSSNGIVSAVKINVCYDFTLILLLVIVIYSIIVILVILFFKKNKEY